MNHEREQQRARSPVADLEYDTEDTIDLEPGQVSRSAFLNKPDQAIASGLGHRRDLGFSHGASRRPALDGLGARGRQDRTPTAALRKLLLAAATSGRGAVDALAAADPTTAAAALRELRTMRVPGRTATALQLVARADNGEAGRLLGRGSTGAALPDDDAARLGPHVGKEAAGAARLHTDDTADLVAAAHDARAVTLGHAIYFARGEYLPGTARGDELLAHELAHVAQAQRGELSRAAAKGIDAGGSLDPAEAEADLRAKHAVIQLHPLAGAPPPLAQPSGQPASKDDRAAKLAAQRQRLSLASHAAPPMPATPPPAESRPQAPVAHLPPKLARPPAPAATRNAYVEAFDAPPSKQATELWADAGTRATTHDAAAQAKFDAELKPFPVVLDGRATPAAKVNAVGAVRTSPPAAGVNPPAAKLAPTPAAPPSKAAQAATKPVKPTADKTQMKAEGQKALDALPTTAPVKTDPGPAPVTDLAGHADPARALGDHHHAVAEGTKALDDAKAKLVVGPGPAQIQPTQLDEKLVVPKAEADGPLPALPAVEGMVEFKQLGLPGNVQAAFDQIAKPRMAQSLAEAKAKLTEAEAKRDADRAKAVGDAHARVEQAHADADKQQQTHVAETRTQIANQQASTLAKQANEVKQLDQQSSEKKKTALGKVNDRIIRDQAQIDSDYQAAHKKADDHKKQGEADAAKKKKEAEDKKGDDSWWSKAAEGLKSLASEIDQALDAASKAIGEVFDAVKHTACKLIDAAHDFVSHTLSEFGGWLKSKVTSLVDSVFPGLTAKLHQFVDRAIAAGKAALQKVSDGLKKSVTSVCGWLKSAASAVAKGFKAAVEMATKLGHALITGDWKAFGKMVLEGVLSLLGIDPAAFYAFIGKVGDSIGKIIAHPGAFVGHLVDAVKLGFHQFGQHFWAHLQRGLMEWLFGTISKTGITLPAKFDLAGVFDVVCQVLGLTRPRMRDKVVKLVGEKNTARFESILHHIEALMTGGFAGLWEQVQQDLSGLWDTILSGVKQWLITQVVEQAIRTLAMMWNPIGALLKLIETAWNLYKWVRENAQRIAGLLHAVVDSMANIVDGNIGTAANLIESSLARLVPIAISLFANLLGIGGIAETVKGIIAKVQTKVDQAIDKLIDRVVKMFKGKGDGKKDDSKPDERTPEQKQADVTKAANEATQLLKQKNATEGTVKKQLPPIKERYKLVKLELIVDGKESTKERVHVHAEINPSADGPQEELPTGMPEVVAEFSTAPSQKGKPRLSKIEMKLQLLSAQAELDKMPIKDWNARRIEFSNKGRGSRSRNEQKKQRRTYGTMLANRLIQRNNRKIEKYNIALANKQLAGSAHPPSPLTTQDAKKRAQKLLKTRAATHVLDQVAGGRGTRFTKRLGKARLGKARENSAIGATWRHIVEEIDKKVGALPDQVKLNAKMNVQIILDGERLPRQPQS